jgi:hypothetical protein
MFDYYALQNFCLFNKKTAWKFDVAQQEGMHVCAIIHYTHILYIYAYIYINYVMKYA